MIERQHAKLDRVAPATEIDVERFLSELHKLAEAIAGINRFTEENFLRLGRIIRNSHNRAQALALYSSSGVSLNLIEQTTVRESLEQIEICFGELVAALQFQDIARQRLEHIQTNLINLGQHLARWQTPGSQLPLDICGSVCALQDQQLRATAVEFKKSASVLCININQMGTSLEQLETIFASLVPETSDFHAELRVLAANFDLGKQFEALLAPVRDHLAGFAHWSNKGNIDDKLTIDSLFQKLEQCYTMSKERRVHQRFLAGADQQDQTNSEQEDQLGKPHDLGDNVDLF